MTLNLVSDTDFDAMNDEICDLTLECMFPEVGSGPDALYRARYTCFRCSFEGEAAFGPLAQMSDVNEQALALFVAGVDCKAGAV